MRTITTKVFTFEELSEKAKVKALDHYRDINTDHDWYEFTLNYVKELFATFGIEVDKVYFSGFCSQGDGAMFTGRYQYKTKGVKALKGYAPEIPKEVMEAAIALQTLQKKHGYRIAADISHSHGNYYHEYMMDFNTWDSKTDDTFKFYDNGAEAELKEIMRSLARWIYRTLETEYYELQEDGNVQETIECNNYEFTKSGKPLDLVEC
jgi:hypothetical protein